jgi:hypothetical protein
MAGYLALTLHWIATNKLSGRLMLRAALIGFHRLKNKHTGRNIARTIQYLRDRAGVMLKVCISYYISFLKC